MKLCSHCNLNPSHAHKLCTVCIKYRDRHGGEMRPLSLIKRTAQRRSKAKWCKVCGNPGVCVLRRCQACYAYWTRHHKERPTWLWDEDFRCIVCGFPKKAAMRRKDRPGRKLFVKNRCSTCFSYYLKYGKDRPSYLWGNGTYGWCDCGYPANYWRGGVGVCARCNGE